MKGKSLAAPVLALGLIAAGAGLATAAHGAAASKAKSTVTIAVSGSHLSGRINSPKKNKCASGRTVHIMMQMGARGNDMQMGWVSASRQGSWSAAPGMGGKYYAVVKATRACKGDASSTVRL
jgi:hypothetical protein